MKPKFREDKATQAAAILLRARGGTMSYMKLLKLLYLADREALIRWGRPITYDSYVAMKNGPVLSRTYNLVSQGDPPGEESLWTTCISEPEHYSVSLKGDCDADQLSDAEEELLLEIFGLFGAKGRWDLVEFTHTLPEWSDPGDSALPIGYEAILRGAGKSEAESAEIVQELEQVAVGDLLFG
jgi:uncharacterized phage-associated protein